MSGRSLLRQEYAACTIQPKVPDRLVLRPLEDRRGLDQLLLPPTGRLAKAWEGSSGRHTPTANVVQQNHGASGT